MNRWDKLCDTVGMISRQRDTPSVHQAAGVGGRGRGNGQAVWGRRVQAALQGSQVGREASGGSGTGERLSGVFRKVILDATAC